MSSLSLRKIVFSLFMLAAASLLYFRHHQIEQAGTLRWFDRSILWVTTPVAKVVTATRDGIQGFFHRYIYLIGAAKENERLKIELSDYQTRQMFFEELKQENLRLKSALEIRSSLPGKWVGAQVIMYTPLTPYRILTINKGSKDGIVRRAPVVSTNGLVGQIARVFPEFSEVLLITDPSSAVDGRLESSGARGLIVGKSLELGLNRETYVGAFEYLSQATEIQEGAQVVTSGMDGLYPAGIAIGKVASTKKKKYDIFQEALVVPAVDFNKLREVMVLQR